MTRSHTLPRIGMGPFGEWHMGVEDWHLGDLVMDRRERCSAVSKMGSHNTVGSFTAIVDNWVIFIFWG